MCCQIEEAKGTEAVVDRYHDHIALFSEHTAIVFVGGACGEPATMDPHQYRTPATLNGRRHDVEEQAVLIQFTRHALPKCAGRLGLHGPIWEPGTICGARPWGSADRWEESEISRGRLCIADAKKSQGPPVLTPGDLAEPRRYRRHSILLPHHDPILPPSPQFLLRLGFRVNRQRLKSQARGCTLGLRLPVDVRLETAARHAYRKEYR